MPAPRLELRQVSKTYSSDGQRVEALRDVSLRIEAGAITALVGRSGCGKSTLLNLAGAMDFPTSGEVLIDGRSTAALSEHELTRLRRADGDPCRALERRHIPDHVVGRQDQQHRIDRVGVAADAFERGVRGECDGGRGIATERLENGRPWADMQLAHLLGHQEPVRLVAHDQRRRSGEPLETQYRLLQQGARPGERQQLLRIQLTRQRPQARAGAAGENDWSEHAVQTSQPLQAAASSLPRPTA